MRNEVEACSKRNYGVDLLRILSMLMIIRLHAGSIGGLLNIDEKVDIFTVEIWFIQILCVVSVNIFVLISGYFLSAQEFCLSRIFRLWTQTLFYSVLIYIIMVASQMVPFTIEGAIHSLFPVTFCRYWFITAYIGMSLLAPFINKAMEGLNQTQHKFLIFLLVIMTSIWSDLIPSSNTFDVNGGYTLIWFLVLYVISSYIRKYGGKCQKKKAIFVYLAMGVLILLSVIAFYILSFWIPKLASEEILGNYLRYNSIFVLIESIALFLFFLNVKIESKVIIGIIRFITPLIMGVYIIHCDPETRYIVWEIFSVGGERNWTLPIKTIGAVLGIFCSCIFIDYIRLQLFKLIEKRRCMKKVILRIDELPKRIYAFLIKNL